jgi:hypothetical protein
MLRRDAGASFEKSGAWIFSHYRFRSGRVEARRVLNRAAFEALRAEQAETPRLVCEEPERRRRWWMFRDEFYREDEGYAALEVKALALARLTQRERRLQRALSLMTQQEPADSSRRAPIAQAVRLAVFRRDGGACVECGTTEGLQFDHVIPVALGGASTVENLQVLCAACNLAKGASIV